MSIKDIARNAEAAGMTYFMGPPCTKCGNEWRYVKGSCACVECRRIHNKAYQRENAPKMLSLQKRWRSENAEHYKTWRECHKQYGAKALIEYGAEK